MSEQLIAPGVEASTLVELLRYRALHQSHRLAYRFLADGNSREVRQRWV